jgi:hypothetical protein
LFAYGGQLGGMGFYLKDGKPTFILNALNGDSVSVTAPETLAAGSTQIRLEVAKGTVAPDGKADYHVTMSAAGRLLTQGTLHFAIPVFFGISEVFGVGSDAGSAVLANYSAGTPLPGRISDVVFDFSATGSAAPSEVMPAKPAQRMPPLALQ